MIIVHGLSLKNNDFVYYLLQVTYYDEGFENELNLSHFEADGILSITSLANISITYISSTASAIGFSVKYKISKCFIYLKVGVLFHKQNPLFKRMEL